MSRLVYAACVFGGVWARVAAETCDEVAVLLENLAGELAPCDVGGEA